MALREEFTYTGARSYLGRKVWSSDLHLKVQDLTFFKRHGMIGKDKVGENVFEDDEFSNFPVVYNDEIKGKGKGDEVTLGMFTPLTGAGVSGTTSLVDSEENLTFRNVKVSLSIKRNGAGWLGEMTEQRSPFEIPNTINAALKLWMAQQIDSDIFATIYRGWPAFIATDLSKTAYAHPNKLFGGTATSEAEVESSGVLNTDCLERAAVWCDENNIPYCKIKGYDDVRPVVIHPRQWKTLRDDPVWRSDNREGWNRGMDNPIFRQAKGICAGFLVHVSNKIEACPDESAGGANYADKRRAIILGANAVIMAMSQNSMEIRTRKEDDYGNKNGRAIRAIYGMRRADWDTDADASYHNQSSATLTTWAPDVA